MGIVETRPAKFVAIKQKTALERTRAILRSVDDGHFFVGKQDEGTLGKSFAAFGFITFSQNSND